MSIKNYSGRKVIEYKGNKLKGEEVWKDIRIGT